MITLTILCILAITILVLWLIFRFTLWSLVTFWPLWIFVLIVWLLCSAF